MTENREKILKKISSYFARGSIGLFIGIILDLFTRKPTYLNYLILTMILILLILIAIICELWSQKGSTPEPSDKDFISKFMVTKKKAPGIIILLILVGISYFIIAPFIFPSFEILNPKPNSYVPQFLDVSGHGAIPESLVQIAIIDEIGNTWLSQDIATTNQDGKWEVKNVQFGESDDSGKEFKIYAILRRENNVKFTSQSIIVARIT